MKVTAEGMETPTQAEQLKALQCGDIQGYGFHRPLQPKCWKRLLLGAPPAEFSHASAGLRVARRLSSTGAKMGSVTHRRLSRCASGVGVNVTQPCQGFGPAAASRARISTLARSVEQARRFGPRSFQSGRCTRCIHTFDNRPSSAGPPIALARCLGPGGGPTTANMSAAFLPGANGFRPCCGCPGHPDPLPNVGAHSGGPFHRQGFLGELAHGGRVRMPVGSRLRWSRRYPPQRTTCWKDPPRGRFWAPVDPQRNQRPTGISMRVELRLAISQAGPCLQCSLLAHEPNPKAHLTLVAGDIAPSPQRPSSDPSAGFARRPAGAAHGG